MVTLTPAEIATLDDRAPEVGKVIGWDLRFVVAPSPEFVGLIAGPGSAFVVGPALLSELAAHDVDVTLDAFERGDQILFLDGDGDPHLGMPV